MLRQHGLACISDPGLAVAHALALIVTHQAGLTQRLDQLAGHAGSALRSPAPGLRRPRAKLLHQGPDVVPVGSRRQKPEHRQPQGSDVHGRTLVQKDACDNECRRRPLIYFYWQIRVVETPVTD